MHANSLYWFTLTTRATSSSQKPLGNPLSNQTRLQNTTHQSNLEPLKKHTTFGKPHQEYWSWTPQEHTTLLGNTTTEIQKIKKRITPDQSITENNTIAILFHSHLKIQSLMWILKTWDQICQTEFLKTFSYYSETYNNLFIFSKDWLKHLMKERIQLEII